MLNYNHMFNYVKKVLEENNGIKSMKPHLKFRNRFEHIKRVFKWAEIIMQGVDKCDKEVILTSSIFHDCGYMANRNESHAILGKRIFLNYAKENNLDKEFSEKVAYMIEYHSNKELLQKGNIPVELIILMEADLLDEEGALGIVFDILVEGTKSPTSFNGVLPEISGHSAHILSQDYMKTPIAKKIWNEKKNLVEKFVLELKRDLFI